MDYHSLKTVGAAAAISLASLISGCAGTQPGTRADNGTPRTKTGWETYQKVVVGRDDDVRMQNYCWQPLEYVAHVADVPFIVTNLLDNLGEACWNAAEDSDSIGNLLYIPAVIFRGIGYPITALGHSVIDIGTGKSLVRSIDYANSSTIGDVSKRVSEEYASREGIQAGILIGAALGTGGYYLYDHLIDDDNHKPDTGVPWDSGDGVGKKK